MKRLLMAGAAVLASVTAVSAADVPRQSYPEQVVVPDPIYDWSGYYVGAQGGYGSLSDGYDDFGGALAGGTVGFNAQDGNWVYGIEGDASWSGIEEDTAFDIETEQGSPGTATGEFSLDWLATLRGRAGHAFDNVLVFASAGLAVGGTDLGVRVQVPAEAIDVSVGDSVTHFGWTAGAGVEVGFGDAWSLKAEYLYADLGEATYELGGVEGDIDLDMHIVRGGVNYRF